MNKRFFVFSIFLVLLFSITFSATVTDTTTTVIEQQANAQSFAQINAKITDLANQIVALKTQNQEFQENAFMKSDLQNLYDNMININRQAEQQLILDNIIIVVMAFCIMFILVGKNLIPMNKKETKIKNELKKPIDDKENMVMPQDTGGM